MQAGVADIIFAGGRPDGGDVADVLHHGREGDGHDGKDGADAEFRHGDGGQGKGLRVFDRGKVNAAQADGQQIRADDAQQDGDDLDHPLAPDVADHDDGQRNKGPAASPRWRW